MTLQAQLEALRDNTLKEIAQVATLKELNQIRVETLGKKGPITEVLRGMKKPFTRRTTSGGGLCK